MSRCQPRLKPSTVGIKVTRKERSRSRCGSRTTSSQSRLERLQGESVRWREDAKQACQEHLPRMNRNHGSEIEILCFSPKQGPIAIGVSGHPESRLDWSHWYLIVRGPRMTPYVGGMYDLCVQIPRGYPESSPRFEFRSPASPLCAFVCEKTGSVEHPLYHVLWDPSMTLIQGCLLILHDIFFTPRFALYRGCIRNTTLAFGLDATPMDTCLNISSQVTRDVTSSEMSVDIAGSHFVRRTLTKMKKIPDRTLDSSSSSMRKMIDEESLLKEYDHSLPAVFEWKHPDTLSLSERPLNQGCSLEQYISRRNQIRLSLLQWSGFSQDLMDILFDYYGSVHNHCYFGRYDLGFGPGQLISDCFPKIESDILSRREIRVKQLHRRTMNGGESSESVFTLPISLKIVYPAVKVSSESKKTTLDDRLSAGDAAVTKSSSAGTLERLHRVFIDVLPEFKIRDVKALIWARLGIPEEHQVLVADKKLHNWLSLDEFDLRAYAFRSRTVFCLVREEHAADVLQSKLLQCSRASSSSMSAQSGITRKEEDLSSKPRPFPVSDDSTVVVDTTVE